MSVINEGVIHTVNLPPVVALTFHLKLLGILEHSTCKRISSFTYHALN